MKKFLIGCMSFFMLASTLVSPTYASDDTIVKESSISTEEILSALTPINYIPEGVEPLYFETEQEFIDFFTQQLNSKVSVTFESENKNLQNQEKSKLLSGSYTAKFNQGLCTFNLSTDYTYTNPYESGELIGPPDYRERRLSSTSPSCYLTGFSWGTALGSHSVSSTIESGNTAFVTQTSGALEYYVFIEGIGNLFSTPFNASYKYDITSMTVSDVNYSF